MQFLKTAVTLISFALVTFSQTPAGSRLEFDVASVKIALPPPGQSININLGTILNGRLTLTNTTLADCIRFAYDLVSQDLIAGPDWIKLGGTRYEITALFPVDTPTEKVRLMLQTLLAERLRLSVRRELRDVQLLELVVARDGHKLRPSSDDPAAIFGAVTGAGRIIHPRMPMSVLTMLLSRFERETIVDKTDLAGAFGVRLEWTPANLRSLARSDGAPVSINGQLVDVYGPSVFTAVQEQLGLRLESRKGPLDVLVVDHAEKSPTEN